MLVGLTHFYGFNMGINIKFAKKIFTILNYLADCFFAFILCICLTNGFFITKPLRYSYSFLSNMDNAVTLKVSDPKSDSSVLWKYDWYAGYDLAYHYAAKDTKVTFSSKIDDWTISLNNIEINDVTSFISTSSRVHEYKQKYFGDYLSFKVISGIDWIDYKGENDIFISEATYNSISQNCGYTDMDNFLSTKPILKFKKNDLIHDYTIVGILENESLKQYFNIYGNIVFGSVKALTYNGFSNHFLDITAFTYDVQGWNTEFAYIFNLMGSPESNECVYQYATNYSQVYSLSADSPTFSTLLCFCLFGLLGFIGVQVMFFLKKCKNIGLDKLIFINLLMTFLLFLISICTSRFLFSNLKVIIDNYAVFFLYIFISALFCFATNFIAGINEERNRLYAKSQYYKISI